MFSHWKLQARAGSIRWDSDFTACKGPHVTIFSLQGWCLHVFPIYFSMLIDFQIWSELQM